MNRFVAARRWPILALAGLAWLAGCNAGPRAPVLKDEPVYQNDREGFRFLVPPGWIQRAKGELPPGRLTRESLLVHYARPDAGPAALLEVTAADLPESADLAAEAATPSFGVKSWRVAGPAESIDVGGVPGVRIRCAGTLDGTEMTKEVVAVRRGERVYFFTAMFATADQAARDQVRQAVASTIWKS
jgi:hypothetical protein